jgi:hypothetical protein
LVQVCNGEEELVSLIPKFCIRKIRTLVLDLGRAKIIFGKRLNIKILGMLSPMKLKSFLHINTSVDC